MRECNSIHCEARREIGYAIEISMFKWGSVPVEATNIPALKQSRHNKDLPIDTDLYDCT